MRIVYLNPASQIGGGERGLLAWLKAVRLELPQAELFLVLPAIGPLGAAATALGVHVEVVPMPKAIASLGDRAFAAPSQNRILGYVAKVLRLLLAAPQALAYVLRLRRCVRRLRPDLVQSNGIKTHVLSRLVAPRGVPVLWQLQDLLGRRAAARSLRWASKRVARVAAASEAIARDARIVLPATPVEVIYNVTDVEHFCPAVVPRQSLDALAQLPPAPPEHGEPIRVALVAAFARWKGQDVFLDAAALALQQLNGTPARFYIVGGPLYQTRGSQFSEPELRTQTQRLGIEASVGFIPFQPDPRNIYRAADIVVHASTQPEPFGLTIVEAMACGRAVIVAKAGGAAELFTDGLDALGTPPGDPAALAQAMTQLITDRDLRLRLAGQARLAVLKHFDARDLPRQIRRLYGQIDTMWSPPNEPD